MFQVTYEEKVGTRQPTSESTPENPSLVRYVECTIHPLDETVVLSSVWHCAGRYVQRYQHHLRRGHRYHVRFLKKRRYMAVQILEVSPPSPTLQLLQILNGLQCSATRKALIQNALSLVGKVPYFWGGKSGPGWNEEWGTPKLVTSAGSASSGQLRPYGMDCSGFTDWVYKTTDLPSIGAGSAINGAIP